jgi:1,2-phenylacetyl-CoA epoxidase PaaB subunit
MSTEPSFVYKVFARVGATEPLQEVGSVRAPCLELARVYARTTYDEDRWIEMVAVPRTSVVQVIP